VQDYEVPVPLVDLRSMVTKDWDLTMKKVIPFINSVYYVKKIAELSQVDIALVRGCIEHLW